MQLIDLPGGNRRFASFAFGTGTSPPRLVLQSPRGSVEKDVATPVSVSLRGASARDVREIWLHVGAPGGSWKRYAMTVLPGEAGAVGVVVFPAALLDDHGNAPFYVSALMSTGEECFTEIFGSSPGAATRVRAPTAP